MSDPLNYQQLDIQQQALKLTANRFMLSSDFQVIPPLHWCSFQYLLVRSLEFDKLNVFTCCILQYVWLLRIHKLDILCKSSCKAYHLTGKWKHFLLWAIGILQHNIWVKSEIVCAGTGDLTEYCRPCSKPPKSWGQTSLSFLNVFSIPRRPEYSWTFLIMKYYGYFLNLDPIHIAVVSFTLFCIIYMIFLI